MIELLVYNSRALNKLCTKSRHREDIKCSLSLDAGIRLDHSVVIRNNDTISLVFNRAMLTCAIGSQT